MKKAQVYKIKNIEGEKPRLGSFVFYNNDDDNYVRGFISDTSEEFSEICLWESTDVFDLKNLIEVIAEDASPDFISTKLKETLENADDEMLSKWKELFEEARKNVSTIG